MIRLNSKLIKRHYLVVGIVWGLGFCFTQEVYAVVGRAERFDEIKEQELKDFQQLLLKEEKVEELTALEALQEVDQKTEDKLSEEGEEVLSAEEIKLLKEQILALPDRDLFRFELHGSYYYSDNVDRRKQRDKKGDTVFTADGAVLIDFSGKKTDLTLELKTGRRWNYEFSTKDLKSVEERIRYRRKYFKKLKHSIQSRIARTETKTIEIDTGDGKVRWDSNQQTSLNFAVSRKLRLNLDANLNHRIFTTEAADQDSQWQFRLAPAMQWFVTPKSRIHAGYSYGESRPRSVGLSTHTVGRRIERPSNSQDTDAHDFNAGYFGKLTRKSSVSLDARYTRQYLTPKEATKKTYLIGLGYIFQFSPKTQLNLQYIHKVQDTTSNKVVGTENSTTKTDTSFTHDSFTVGMNHKITRKFNQSLRATVSHLRNKNAANPDSFTESKTFTFPVSYSLRYDLTRWMQLSTGYAYAFRTGNAKEDTYSSSTWRSDVTLKF